MEAKDLKREDLELVRLAMTSDDKKERSKLLDGHENAQAYFLEKWNERKVCGQCNHYTQLGDWEVVTLVYVRSLLRLSIWYQNQQRVILLKNVLINKRGKYGASRRLLPTLYKK